MGKQSIKNNEGEKENFKLPIDNEASEIKENGFYCPGSLVKLNLEDNQVFTWGMPEKTGVFYRGEPVFSTSIPVFDMDRRVLGSFPEKNLLLSGYAEKEKQVGGKPAMVWVRKGKGELILFSFNPQFRASTQATYKLIFNSLLFSKIE
jgi:hypothetical protein